MEEKYEDTKGRGTIKSLKYQKDMPFNGPNKKQWLTKHYRSSTKESSYNRDQISGNTYFSWIFLTGTIQVTT